MDVYDLGGLAGIYIPGAITRDVAKQSADNGLQLMELTSLDPSVKAQATAAGISTAKNLFSRKIKQVKVLVKSGYKVLLKEKLTSSLQFGFQQILCKFYANRKKAAMRLS